MIKQSTLRALCNTLLHSLLLRRVAYNIVTYLAMQLEDKKYPTPTDTEQMLAELNNDSLTTSY